MKASVALCTFNGERFLAEQLESILSQTRLPDEIILSDDRSDDDTINVARRYEKKLPLRILINAERQGSTRNFARAIDACSGDVIFLCDQDDAWEANKVEIILHRFSAQSAPGMVFSDAVLIDRYSRPTGDRLWKVNRFTDRRKTKFARGKAFGHLLRSNIVTGATAAFRREFNELILPIPEGWVHDHWIATIIAGYAPILAEPMPLTRYRIHSGQQIGVDKHSWSKLASRLETRKDLSAECTRYMTLQTRIAGSPSVESVYEESQQLVQQKLDHIARRTEIAGDPIQSVAALFNEVVSGNYSRFSYGFVDVFSDLLFRVRSAK